MSISNIPFKTYDASAGAGKTFTLVAEYLKLALKYPDHGFRNILAITFTNKASSEMKERIISSLSKFAQYPLYQDDPMSKRLQLEMNLDAQSIAYRSKDCLSSILHQYSNFGVSTIDKFTNKLIRSFSSDLKLSSNYEVELDSEEILSEAVDRMLMELQKDSENGYFLLDYIASKLEDEKSHHIENGLKKMAKQLFDESAFYFIDELKSLELQDFINAKNSLKKTVQEFENHLSSEANKIEELLGQEDIGKEELSQYALPSFLNKLKKGLIDQDITATIHKAVEKGTYFKTTSKRKEQDSLVMPLVHEKVLSVYNFINDQYGLYHEGYHALSNIHSMALLSEIDRKLSEIKQETNKLPIGEFNKLVSEKLRNEPAPYLYEKLGNRYQHFFIDEFQDTSNLQWNNLLPLINNSLADVNGSALIVGDAKQSIYRWRGGDVRQFIGIKNNSDSSNKSELANLELYKRETIQLLENYRSRVEVVEFNNKFFNWIADQQIDPELKEIYQKASQQPMGKEGGYVRMDLFSAEGDEQVELMGQKIEAIIAEALEANYSLSDICILSRNKQQLANTSAYLLEKGYTVISPDSLSLGYSKKVQAIVSFLRLFVYPEDYQSRQYFLEEIYKHAEVSRHYKESYIFYTELYKMKLDDLLNFMESHFISFQRSEFFKRSLLEKVYYLIDLFGYRSKMDAFLNLFIDQMSAYMNSSIDGDIGFLHWWDDKGHKKNINLSEGVNAIQLMTIHASKGLEFPIVIQAYSNWKTANSTNTNKWMKVNPDEFGGLKSILFPLRKGKNQDLLRADYAQLMEEERSLEAFDDANILYVSMTRAVDCLFILGAMKKERANLYVSKFYQNFLAFEGASDYLEYGSFEPKENVSANKVEIGLEPYETIDWNERLSMSFSAPNNWTSETSSAQNWGKKVHSVLSEIRNVDEIDKVLKKQLNSGAFIEEDMTRLENVLIQISKNEEVKKYFDNFDDLLNEREIISPGSSSYIPDRVVFKNGECHILDYKTGSPHERYKKQVNEYATILEQMGYKVGDRCLLYLGEKLELERW